MENAALENMRNALKKEAESLQDQLGQPGNSFVMTVLSDKEQKYVF